MAIDLQLSLGGDADVYNRLIASLPPGDDNLTRGVVVPSHTTEHPVDLEFSGLTAGTMYTVQVVGEQGIAPTPLLIFNPTSDTYTATLALPPGQVMVRVMDPTGTDLKFSVSVTNFAWLFRAYAQQLTQYSNQPISLVAADIASSVGYRLALPLLGELPNLIPPDLETLAILANKLVIKNLVHRPGSDGSTRELFGAFSANNPVMFPMRNLGKIEVPLFRSESHFSGREVHCWLPNREIERWQALILLLNNLPQIYTLRQITEGEIYFTQNGQLRRHLFDFESSSANSILGTGLVSVCFTNLFKFDLSIDTEHFIAFCAASYPFDNAIAAPGLVTADADPLQLTNWTNLSLIGRFEQQYGIAYRVHGWHFESPIDGTVDGVNRFFRLAVLPAAAPSTKLWIDGLLQRYGIDYRVSNNNQYRSGEFSLQNYLGGPINIAIQVGNPRPFLAPIFCSVEVLGGDDLQYVVTGSNQDLLSINFTISDPPTTTQGDPDEIRLHYVSPALPAVDYPGPNQYGTVPLPLNTTTYSLVYPVAATNPNYQLICLVAHDPTPDPQQADQLVAQPRYHTLTGATIDLSGPVEQPAVYLHWWLVEGPGVALERGTLVPPDGSTFIPIFFTAGPYTDNPVVIVQLWHTSAATSYSLVLTSQRSLTPSSVVVQFSEPLAGAGGYRLDYLVFPSASGTLLETTVPPDATALVEVQYDDTWPHWTSQGLLPPPDGVETRFSVSLPIPDPQALYLGINGRLADQGPDGHYLVDNPFGIRFNSPPAPGQELWAVYPLADPSTGRLPSRWAQGRLSQLPAQVGIFGTGQIENTQLITGGDTVVIRGRVATAVTTARGRVLNLQAITPGDSLKFITANVQLTAVLQNPGPGQFAAGLSQDADAQALVQAINGNATLAARFLAVYLGAGTTEIRALALTGTASNETLVAGSSLVTSPITGDSAPGPGLFAATVTRALDSAALAGCLSADPFLLTHYRSSATAGSVLVTALAPGLQENAPIQVTGFSLTAQAIGGGRSPDPDPDRFVTSEVCYHGDGAVICLDGIETRRYDLYSGSVVRYTALPAPLVEPSYIAETFPIDYHPLDSMTANQPCSYPDGPFTQGTATCLTEIPVTVDLSGLAPDYGSLAGDGTLQIVTNGLPVQQQPTGVVDGVNQIFTLTTKSCAGQSSMLVWLDTVWQPPDQWSYLDLPGPIGQITFNQPPQLGQKVWTWYIPEGDGCPYEEVVALTGTLDGINGTFGIPAAPMVDAGSVVLWLDGLFQLQSTDYVVLPGNVQAQYLGLIRPQAGQSLWCHFNQGVVGTDRWRQIRLGTADGLTGVFTIPAILTSDLPTSADSILLFLDGGLQRLRVDFSVTVDLLGFPTGALTFLGGPPEAGRVVDVAFIKR